MDALMIVLRLIHIFAGIAWAGGSMMQVMFIAPTVASLGADGGKFMRQLLVTTRFAIYFPATAILTILSGLIMYYKVSDHFSADWMKSSGGVVLSLGSLAGILAAGHGGSTIGRASARLRALMLEMSTNPPSPEQAAELGKLQGIMRTHSPIALALTLLAVFGMASARYF